MSRKVLKAPRRERPDSDVEDALPTLSVSDCATDGPDELRRVGGGIDGASWLDCPVVGDSVMGTLLAPEADIASGPGV